MGILTAARVSANEALPVDVYEDDPLWTAADTEAYCQWLVDEPVPDVPGLLDEPAPASMSRWAQLAELQVLAVQQARCAARQGALLVALTGPEPRSREVTVTDLDDGGTRLLDIVDEVLEEVSVALRRSVASVRRDVATARRLVALPRSAAALAGGTISPAHAEAIARISDGLPAHLLPAFEGRVLAKATAATVGETASFARRLRSRLDVTGEESRRRQAARHVDVRIWAEDDGLACLQARLPIVDAARLHAALDARARRVLFDPEQSMGQRRVAALVDAVCGQVDAPSGALPAVVAVNVTVDAATLFGLTDDPVSVELAHEGAVSITAAALRELLADPSVPMTLRRLVVDPATGHLLDRGRTSYRVTDALRRFLVARDGTCRFPHCGRPADGCDIDHITPWDDGGRSDRTNLMPLCRRHHLLKTFGEWSVRRRRDDGTVEWRAPDGSTIVSHPWRAERERILKFWDP